MRGRMRRSQRPEDDSERRQEHAVVQSGFQVLQGHAGNAEEVHQREGPRRHDACRALAALRRRRRIVHGLR